MGLKASYNKDFTPLLPKENTSKRLSLSEERAVIAFTRGETGTQRRIERIKRNPDGEMTGRHFLKEIPAFVDSAHININNIRFSGIIKRRHTSELLFL